MSPHRSGRCAGPQYSNHKLRDHRWLKFAAKMRAIEGHLRLNTDGYPAAAYEKLLATASSASSTLSKRLPTKSAWPGFHLSVAQAR